MYVKANEWLEVIRAEYLRTFVRDGGAAVKFVVPPVELGPERLVEALRQVSQMEGYQFAFVDAARTKVQRIDAIFHEIARQVDWGRLTCSYLSRMLAKNGYRCPESREDFRISTLAELNHRDPGLLSAEMNSLLEKNVFRDYQMCMEFRLAMIRLCQSVLDPGNARPSFEVVGNWLTGTLRLVSEMKPALIFQKIAQHNARHMLASLSHWTHCAGKSGLVVLVDISRCLIKKPYPAEPGDAGLYYSTAALLDAYEVLRECVDTTDEMEYGLVAVAAPPVFLQPDERRSVWRYDALRLRIWDEVRDEHRANPLSSLVRLAPENGTQP
jgi:hypothetical protein